LQALLVTASLKGDGPTNYILTKRQAASGSEPQATSNKQQATSNKLRHFVAGQNVKLTQATSIKQHASKCTV